MRQKYQSGYTDIEIRGRSAALIPTEVYYEIICLARAQETNQFIQRYLRYRHSGPRD